MSTDPTLTGTNMTVATDLPDYAPGSTAQITTTNVGAGDTVTFTVAHLDPGADGIFGTADDVLVYDLSGTGTPWTVTDGGLGDLDGLVNGVIQTSWYVNQDAFGQAFVLSATDQTTGQVAITNFTDAKLSQAPFAYSDTNATGVDMTTASAKAGDLIGVGDGAFGTDIPLGFVSGSGQFQPFVRIQTNLNQEEAYNSTALNDQTIKFNGTTYANDIVNSSNSPNFNPTLTLSSLGDVIISGTM